jgi:hypothetical protein
MFIQVGLLVATSSKVQSLQDEQREMLVQIQRNSQVRQVTGQVATNIVKDMAQLSLQNTNLRALLNKHGFDVQVRQNSNSN